MLNHHFKEVRKNLENKDVFTKLQTNTKKTIKTVVSSPTRTSSGGLKTSSASPISIPLKSVSQVKPASKVLDKKNLMSTTNKPKPNAKQVAKTAVSRDESTECQFCGRRFAEDRLQVHEAICGKTQKKKRKVYDATKHRIQGTELEQYSRKGVRGTAANKAGKSAPKRDWRKTHEEFISTIKAAKIAQAHLAKGGKLSDLPPPPPSSNPDYIQCPHCGRKFNEAAAQRHIPQCANYSFNKPKLGAGSKAKLGRK